MKSKFSGLKKAALFLCAAVLCVWLGRPESASGIWNGTLAFFGLGDFAACADTYPMSMHVLDVGKADAIFVECGGKYMLIDGGMPDSGKNVSRYLKRRGVDTLEFVFNSHPDEDHIGGLACIINDFSVKKYFAPCVPGNILPQNDAYTDTQAALKGRHITSGVPKAGDTYFLGGLKIDVLGPLKQGLTVNNNSIILKLTYGSVSFLLTGDAEKEEENSLLDGGADLSADVLKVAHHGSGTSTTQAFLSAVHPRCAAVSVGYDRNKLPKGEVMERLYSAGASVYRTDVSGTLLFMTDGKTISIKTEK